MQLRRTILRALSAAIRRRGASRTDGSVRTHPFTPSSQQQPARSLALPVAIVPLRDRLCGLSLSYQLCEIIVVVERHAQP